MMVVTERDSEDAPAVSKNKRFRKEKRATLPLFSSPADAFSLTLQRGIRMTLTSE